MGSNQSKPTGDEKDNGKKKGNQPANESALPTVIEEGNANPSGDQSVPMTPLTPIAPSNTMTAAHPSASAPPQVHVNIHELEGHSNVSRPPPPRRVRHLSELIDPNDLPRDYHARSPSGNILGVDEIAAHPDRPKSLRERREEVLKRVRAMSQSAENAGDGAGDGGSGVPAVPSVPAAAAGVENVKPTAEGGKKDVAGDKKRTNVKDDKKKTAKQAAKERKIRAAAREKKAKAAAKERKARAVAREKKRKATRKEKQKKLKVDRKKKEKARAKAKKEKEAKVKGEMKAMKRAAAAERKPWWKRCFCC